MSKFILPALFAALVCAAGSASADQGISSKTLGDMGLSGLTVISDSDALAVRGFGYQGSKKSHKAKMTKRRDSKKVWSSVYGDSFATVTDKHGNTAHSENGYAAEGPYAASGENFSEATLTTTDIEIVDIDGVVKSVTNVWTTHVEAGGFSSAMSF